ncbi:MAG: cupin domain-containing protein [Pseudomonadota bacterium]
MNLTTNAELLTAYAAGEISPGLALLCETYLAVDDRDQGFVSMAESVAGAALRDAPQPCAAAMDRNALFARLDEPDETDRGRHAAAAPALASAEALASPARLGERSIPWRFRMPGLSEHVLDGFGAEKVSLMRARPGSRLPQHTHRGFEATLVLAGAMKDEDRVLQRGDIALCGQEHDHHPEIIGDETCYCLVVVDGGLRFTGALGRAFNLFADRRRS